MKFNAPGRFRTAAPKPVLGSWYLPKRNGPRLNANRREFGFAYNSIIEPSNANEHWPTAKKPNTKYQIPNTVLAHPRSSAKIRGRFVFRYPIEIRCKYARISATVSGPENAHARIAHTKTGSGSV